MIKESTLSLNATVKAYCRLIRSTSFRSIAVNHRREINSLLNYYHEHSYISDDIYDYYRNMTQVTMVEGGFMASDIVFGFGLHASRAYKPIFKEDK